MEYKLADLLDVPKLQALFDSLDKLHQLPSAVIDIEGNILTATAWQDICTKFHRVDPRSEKECIKSDTHLVGELSKGKTQVVYKCPHGLVDAATPIKVDGKHFGNAFTGQFFLEPPDEEHYRGLARKYGFHEEAYIEAMRKVPVITEDRHKKNLEVLASLTEMFAEMGLKQKRQLEVEQALRESRETFKTLVEFTSAIHWELDLATNKFTYISPQIESILGYTPDRWATFELWAETVHPDDREYAVNYCTTETAKGNDHAFVYRAIAADGTIVWLHDIVKVISENDQPVKLIGVMLDISNQKAIEQDLSDFKKTLDNSFDCVFMFEPDTFHFTYINKGAVEQVGYSYDELLKMTPLDIKPEFTADLFREMVAPLLDGTKPYHSFETVHRHKNGHDIPVEIVLQFVSSTYEKGKFIAIVRDMTERKKAEESLHLSSQIILQSKYSIVSTDLDGIITSWNIGAEGLFGYTLSEMLGKHISVVYPESEHQYLQDEIMFPLMQMGAHETITRMIRKSGEEFLANITLWLLKNEKGRPIGMVGYSIDITERKLAEQKIYNSLKEKEVLLKEVHHRVKNNMAVISSLLSLQSGYVDDKKYLDMFNESQSRIRSMALVHEKLYKSKDFAHIDVQDYVSSLSHNVKSTFMGRKDVSVNINVEAMDMDIDNLIPCGLIINELLSNAFKHAFDGIDSPEISISMAKAGDDNVSLTIRDNGTGLPEAFDISRSKGLGLKLVLTLARQLDGKLEVTGLNGTTFQLTFPEKLEPARHIPDNG
ncbi:MAG: PAS domain S-box protein [Thermodesulfovibrionales bacterium]|nr:PAS domain S-box protein [Thermodesulfovibrionales bacterium]